MRTKSEAVLQTQRNARIEAMDYHVFGREGQERALDVC